MNGKKQKTTAITVFGETFEVTPKQLANMLAKAAYHGGTGFRIDIGKDAYFGDLALGESWEDIMSFSEETHLTDSVDLSHIRGKLPKPNPKEVFGESAIALMGALRKRVKDVFILIYDDILPEGKSPDDVFCKGKRTFKLEYNRTLPDAKKTLENPTYTDIAVFVNEAVAKQMAVCDKLNKRAKSHEYGVEHIHFEVLTRDGEIRMGS